MGSVSVPLDDMVAMAPHALRALFAGPGGRPRRAVLACTAGPKSCVAWDFLTAPESVRSARAVRAVTSHDSDTTPPPRGWGG